MELACVGMKGEGEVVRGSCKLEALGPSSASEGTRLLERADCSIEVSTFEWTFGVVYSSEKIWNGGSRAYKYTGLLLSGFICHDPCTNLARAGARMLEDDTTAQVWPNRLDCLIKLC